MKTKAVTSPQRLISLCTAALCLTMGALESPASHRSNERYDGTVDSIHWLAKPIPVSHVTFRDSEGNKVSMSDFKGKFVLLNFWSVACGPCLAELPALDRLNLRLGGAEFVTLPVTVDEDVEAAKHFFSGRLMLRSLNFYRESRARLGMDFPMDVLPASFIIDRNGDAIGFTRNNIAWDGPRAVPMFERLFAGQTAATIPAQSNAQPLQSE
jgi:thiol-disulfide isomerase/thioredoxin